jgi:Predicted nucleic acid-binding protein, contains PIN domain
MIAIADSPALVALSICDSLILLDALFGEVKAPQAVYDEICLANKADKAESQVLQAYLAGKICSFPTSINIEKSNALGKGELAAIGLYKQLSADLLLIDDARAKKVAYLNNLEVMGSLDVLLLAKKKGLIATIKPSLTRLRCSDIYVSEHLLEQILMMAGESTE